MKKNLKQIIVIMSLTMLVTLNSSVLMTNTYAATASAGKVDAVTSATTKPPVTPPARVPKPVVKPKPTVPVVVPVPVPVPVPVAAPKPLLVPTPAPAKSLLNVINMQNVVYIEGYNDFKLVLDDQLNVLSIKQLNQPIMTFETITNKPLYYVLEMLKAEIGYSNASFKANPFIIVGYGVALDKNTNLDLIKQTFAPEVFSYEAYLNMITNETKMSKLGDTYSNLDYKVKSSLVFDESTVPTILTITSIPIVETAIAPSLQNDDVRDGDQDDEDENENHEDFDVDEDDDDEDDDHDEDNDHNDEKDEDDDHDED